MTKYIGVSRTNEGRYRARLQVHYQWINCGTFATPEEAAGARDDYIIRHRVPNRQLNFQTGENQ